MEYDVIIIGGGLLGCFAARNLARYDLKTALLEKREDICTGISRANTAIIYSGCDTKPGTLKTSMCVRAAQSFPQLCDELGVRYSRCGSIMICFGEGGAKSLRKKLKQGIENGVQGMKLLSRDEVLALEPSIAENVHSGLFVPDTGTVMPWELCLAAAENAAENGVDILLRTEAIGITVVSGNGGGFRIQTNKGTFYARGIVNCAGMEADGVLKMISAPAARIVPTAGDYHILDTKAAGHIRHVVFHEPEEKGKGLTLVPTVDGNILVGPTEREGDDYSTTREGFNELRELISQVIPTLPMEHLVRSFGAVRPNPHFTADDESINDFCIISGQEGDPAKPDSCLHLNFIGVKTPGLTCANELGMYAAEKMAEFLGAPANQDYDPQRRPPVRLANMAFQQRESFLENADPIFRTIVCRCRGVSEGEIVEAIRRFPGATTVDGVKRRTGAGSGRCQGGFCGQRVTEILARELGLSPEEITKDGEASYFFDINTFLQYSRE